MSDFLNLNWQDFVKGAVVAVLSGALQTVYQALSVGGSIDFKQVGLAALTAFIAYILKNLMTDNQGKLGGVDLK